MGGFREFPWSIRVVLLEQNVGLGPLGSLGRPGRRARNSFFHLAESSWQLTVIRYVLTLRGRGGKKKFASLYKK